MKKLLILLLVIGMSLGANAGLLSLEVYVDGSPYIEWVTPVKIGSTVDVYIVQDAFDPLGSGGEVWVSFEGDNPTATDLTLPDMTDIYGGWSWLSNAIGILGPAAGADEGDFYMGKVANLGAGTPGLGTVMGLSVLPAASRETYTTTNSTAMFSFSYVNPTLVQFTKGTWDGALVSGYVAIPEPMTIALLGLGGLFLRRRK